MAQTESTKRAEIFGLANLLIVNNLHLLAKLLAAPGT